MGIRLKVDLEKRGERSLRGVLATFWWDRGSGLRTDQIPETQKSVKSSVGLDLQVWKARALSCPEFGRSFHHNHSCWIRSPANDALPHRDRAVVGFRTAPKISCQREIYGNCQLNNCYRHRFVLRPESSRINPRPVSPSVFLLMRLMRQNGPGPSLFVRPMRAGAVA